MVAVAYGGGRLRELCITKFKSQFKRGFAKVVVTRAGRLQEWSQAELRPYFDSFLIICTSFVFRARGTVCIAYLYSIVSFGI